MHEVGVKAPTGAMLWAYLLISHAIPVVAPSLLRRRLRRGKEDPARMIEKIGQPTVKRPPGRLIWLHAVGLGEVLALRGLIGAMSEQTAALNFLVTSSARSSAQVMGANLPPRTQHQYLPLDAPSYLNRFLNHWRPDLSIWAEQEIWPGAVVVTHKRGIPLALVNARLTNEGTAKRSLVKGLYANLFARFALIAAQDQTCADFLAKIGANDVRVTGSLKSAAPPLAADMGALEALQPPLAGRRIWVAASTHPGDEAAAIAAQKVLWNKDRSWLLIIVPRDRGRAVSVATAIRASDLPHVTRSASEVPDRSRAVWLADTYGELGLWYRLAETALIGGTFDNIGGHNPWEAAALGAAVLHGADVKNFTTDFALLDSKGAAKVVAPECLASALQSDELSLMNSRATDLVEGAQGGLAPLATDLLALMGNNT